MKGSNTMQLNQSEMKRAIQYYLDNVLLKESVIVTSVSEDRTSNMFEIDVTEPEESQLGNTA